MHQIRISSWGGDDLSACHRHFLRRPAQDLAFPDHAAEYWDAAVVGAGLSGLTAAYHLRDRRVLVLEAGEVPGGVCRQGSYRGITYPAGSAYFYFPTEPAWEAWYRDLGLPLAEALVTPPVSALFFEGRWHADCFSPAGLRRLPLPENAIQGLQQLAGRLAAWEETWDPFGSDALPNAELDRVSLTHYLEHELHLPPAVTQILAPYCRSCLGAGPEAVSAWAGLLFLMSEFSGKSRSAAFPGGNARVAQALAQSLPEPVRCGQTLVRLDPCPQGMDLLVWDGPHDRGYRVRAGVVILAGGKFTTRQVLPEQSGWDLERFGNFRYSSYVVAALCGRLSLENPGYENWVAGEEALSDFVMTPRHPHPGEGRVMTVFAPQPYPEGRAPLMRAQPADMAATLVQSVDRLFPGTAAEVEEVHLYRFGHAQVVPYPGFLSAIKGAIPQAQGRIVLANADLEGLPCIEAAIIAGQKAAARAGSLLAV
jgi:phytoene dehydrogenase-like protein